MKQLLILIVLFAGLTGLGSAQTDMKVTFPNGDEVTHSVFFVESDSVNGRVKAVFASDTSRTAFIGHFVNGKPNGRFLYYYPNGKYHQTMIYGYGNLHGDYTVYNKKGGITKKGIYKNGLKHGYWKDRVNNLIGRYRKGKRHLVWKITDDSGKKTYERWFYRNGKLKRGDQKSADKLEL